MNRTVYRFQADLQFFASSCLVSEHPSAPQDAIKPSTRSCELVSLPALSLNAMSLPTVSITCQPPCQSNVASYYGTNLPFLANPHGRRLTPTQQIEFSLERGLRIPRHNILSIYSVTLLTTNCDQPLYSVTEGGNQAQSNHTKKPCSVPLSTSEQGIMHPAKPRI